MTTINLEISNKLKGKLKEKIKGTNFKSLEEYINYILEKVVSESNSPSQEQAYTKDEEEAVKKRLKEMGYL